MNFWDCFRTVRAEFFGLFSDSSDRIFGTIFGQSWTGLRFGFYPGTDVFVLCGVFLYHCNLLMNGTKKKMVHGDEGTKRCPVLYGFEIWVILCLLLEK